MHNPVAHKQNPKKRKNDNIHEEEIEDNSDYWSRFIVLKSKEGLVPLTKLSPFIIEKCIKSCAGEIKKNVTKLRSGALLIETHRKQQSLNLQSIWQIHNIEISSSPYRTLNSSRGIIRYREDDLDELTDDEICYELVPQGITHVKRFASKRN